MSDYGSPPPPPPPGGSVPPSGDNVQPAGPTPPPPPPPGYTTPQGYAAPPAPGDYGQQPARTGNLAEWFPRVGGYLIDSLIPAIPGGILIGIGTAVGTAGAETDPVTGELTGGNGLGLVIAVLGYLLTLAFTIWNRWVKGGQGQTIGRKVMGITLVSEETGQPIGTLMAFVRDLAHILDSIICGLPIGWAWPLWDAKKQTWADKIMKTVVVTVPK